MSDDDYPCQCPRCRLTRGLDENSIGDFLAQARVAGSRSFPAFKRMAESLYAEEWKGSSVSPATFLMLAGAALFHEATAAMAAESGRPADVHAMLLGMRSFGMTFDIMMSLGEPIEVTEPGMSESIH